MIKPILNSSLFLLIAISSFAQAKPSHEWFLSESLGGLCNHSLVLFSDSTYCSETGCESSSRFSFGKWSQKKNIIKFTPANTSSYEFIQKVEREFVNSKSILVTLYDKYGENITDKIIVGEYVPGKGMYTMELDSTNTKRKGLMHENAMLIITTLQRFTKQKLAFDMDSSCNYKIHLNVYKDWFFNKNSTWDGGGSFSLNRKDDRLISLTPDRLDSDKLLYSEFIKQKE